MDRRALVTLCFIRNCCSQITFTLSQKHIDERIENKNEKNTYTYTENKIKLKKKTKTENIFPFQLRSYWIYKTRYLDWIDRIERATAVGHINKYQYFVFVCSFFFIVVVLLLFILLFLFVLNNNSSFSIFCLFSLTFLKTDFLFYNHNM